MPEPNKKTTLPLFRKDLVLYRGPSESDGSPTFSLYDPTRAQYYKISWAESLILRFLQPDMMAEELCREIEMRSTLHITPEEISAFLSDAHRNHLLAIPSTSQQINEEANKAKINPFKWLLYNYLYIRIPVFKPDNFLEKTLKYVKPLASTPAFIIYFILTFIGIYLLMTRWDEYINTFTYFFNLEGLVSYAAAVISVKIIHELSHAYTAKAFGTRVSTIGVVFIVLWPALYTDVTDSWKLESRKARLAISFAGVAAELVVAGLCTLGWVITEPGLLQSVFFILSSASWLTTLAVNINPALRFDGYYLLCDIWGIDNLQSRAFAITRWKLREWLLGIYVAPPEEGLSEKRILGMVVYSLYTWCYRVFLYTAIAVFIYYKFAKAIGIFLFVLEIGVFLVWPIASEFAELHSLRSLFTLNPRLTATCIILGLLFLWIALPLPHTKEFKGVITPLEKQVIYVPWDSRVQAIYVKRGDLVKPEQILAKLSSPQLDKELGTAKAEESVLEKEADIFEIDQEHQAFYKEKVEELATSTAKVKALTERKKELLIRADISGIVYEWDQYLKPGISLSKGQVLGKIGNLKEIKLVAFVPEIWIHKISVGDKVNFILNNTFDNYGGEVIKISPARAKILEYPSLASLFQGSLPVQPDANNQLLLQEAFYPVEIVFSNSPSLPFGLTGNVEFTFTYHSYLKQWSQYFLNLFWREGGF